MVRVARNQWIAFGAAVVAFGLGVAALRWGIDKGDPRRTLARRIRAEADPAHDMVIIADEAPEIVAALAPVPAVWGTPPIRDLGGFRRLYVLSHGEGPLSPYEARLGTPTSTLAPNAVRWDLDGLRNIHFDITTDALDHATARREGGRFAGPCPRVGNQFHCNSTDDWNHPRVDEHPLGGVSVRCLFSHPQENSQLIYEIENLPRSRFLVGVVGLDDRVYFPAGSPVNNHITFTPSDGAPVIEADANAPNRVGATPYRIALGGHPGRLRFAISTPNAGARSYCFTAVATD